MGRFTRREFLKWQAGAALTVAGSVSGVPQRLWAAPDPDLAVVSGGPGEATRAAVKLLGGMGAFVSSGQKVVIKPNMSFDNQPEMGTTTHPEVVSALAGMCLEAGASSVLIPDHTLRSPKACVENSGIRAACSSLPNSEVRALDGSKGFVATDIPGGEHFTETDVLREVLEADVLIAAPVAKHHSATGVSLSMKGMMGLIADRGVMHRRYELHTAIADLSRLLRADLTVIDVTRALTTKGPSGPGKVERLDTVVASRDMVAADAKVAAMVSWYGQKISAGKVDHIRIAHEWGLGRMDIDNLDVRQLEL
ncbi:MAG: DUF362 domain-containing protein [Desulfonatronovibrionaceae bacterium]